MRLCALSAYECVEGKAENIYSQHTNAMPCHAMASDVFGLKLHEYWFQWRHSLAVQKEWESVGDEQKMEQVQWK